jgi:DNA polymerase-3 subunit beta
LSERKLIDTASEVAAIIPTTTLQEVLRTLSDDVTEVDVLFDETQVRFRVGESEITSRLIDGNYPDYRQLIPSTSETTITLNTSEFVRITKIAGLFARDSGGSVTLTADHDKQTLAVRSIASEYGENTSNTPAEVSSDGQVTLNSRYLSEALSVVDGDVVEFRFSGKLAPCVLTAKSKDVNYKHIIMPLKS